MSSFNQYQYDDLVARTEDPYAQAKYRIILDFLKGKENLHILNAGCGSGELSVLLAEAGHIVHGIDPSGEYIALAQRRLPPALTDRCSFSVGSMESVTDDKKYDIAIATDVLEHIENDRQALANLIRSVRPGGEVILTVPALPSLFGYHDGELGHYRRYTKKTLKACIAATGELDIFFLRSFGFSLIPICFLYSRLLRKPYPIGSSTKSILSSLKTYILRIMLAFDTHVHMPLGTSLICRCRRRLSRPLSD